jgi:hypothetical protein
MNKIIGFLITKQNISLDIDIFKTGLKTVLVRHNEFNVYLWGIGDINQYKINGKYSLSFPLSDNLLDRNILINLQDNKIIIENDWLGSIPVFYNEKEQIVSTLSLYCLKNKAIHPEGLSNFSEFGYSVFEQTPFMDVKFMRFYSRLIISENDLKIEYKNDPILQDISLNRHTSEKETLNLIKNYLSQTELKIDGDIILPTSGGYDSRLLNYFVSDKSRIRSFTYGISKNQSQSFEVVHAKKISEILGTKWQQIELKEYHKYIDDWFKLYGFSTHLHGMYHIEFYKNILKNNEFKNPSFLSGIFGDIWAGSISYNKINNYNELINLGYTHGLNLDLKYLKTKENDIKKRFWMQNSKCLNNDKIKTIFTIRLKLMLISYLTQIPEYFGFPVWTPFLNYDIAIAMLNLPQDRRKNRIWQRDFFKNVGLNLEDMNLIAKKSNKLDYEIAKNAIFEQIDINAIGNYINESRLIKINHNLTDLGKFERVKNEVLFIPKLGGLCRKVGLKNEYLKALYEYYVIKAIEKSIKL